jgi:hypothetical protein
VAGQCSCRCDIPAMKLLHRQAEALRFTANFI